MGRRLNRLNITLLSEAHIEWRGMSSIAHVLLQASCSSAGSISAPVVRRGGAARKGNSAPELLGDHFSAFPAWHRDFVSKCAGQRQTATGTTLSAVHCPGPVLISHAALLLPGAVPCCTSSSRRCVLSPASLRTRPLLTAAQARVATPAEIKEIVTATGSVILAQHGVIRSVKNWGRFLLTHPLNRNLQHHVEGQHFVLRFDCAPAAMLELKRKLAMDPRMVRYNILKLQDQKLGGVIGRPGGGMERVGEVRWTRKPERQRGVSEMIWGMDNRMV